MDSFVALLLLVSEGIGRVATLISGMLLLSNAVLTNGEYDENAEPSFVVDDAPYDPVPCRFRAGGFVYPVRY